MIDHLGFTAEYMATFREIFNPEADRDTLVNEILTKAKEKPAFFYFGATLASIAEKFDTCIRMLSLVDPASPFYTNSCVNQLRILVGRHDRHAILQLLPFVVSLAETRAASIEAKAAIVEALRYLFSDSLRDLEADVEISAVYQNTGTHELDVKTMRGFLDQFTDGSPTYRQKGTASEADQRYLAQLFASQTASVVQHVTAHINAEHREFYEKLSQEPRFTNADRVNPKPELGELIRGGECEMVELKSTLRTNLHTNEFDKAITFSVVKTIAGFVNREGGTILVGVADDGKVIGVDADKFRNQDDCRLFLDNTIGRHLGNIANTLVDYSFQAHEGKHVLVVA